MSFLDRIQALFGRVLTYSPLEVAVELVLIWFVIWGIVRFVKGTRAAGALRGVFVLLMFLVVATIVLRILGGGEAYQRLTFLSDRFLAIVAIALIVVFQPELRRALIRLGEGTFFRSTPGEIAQTIDAIVESANYLSRAKFGGLIVIERSVGLGGLAEEGTRLEAKVSAPLLETIFYPGSALHDLAVIIRGNVVWAAAVQLPLAEPGDLPDDSLGARHRAAVGVTKESDAVVVVVSEETGRIRTAERGRLSEPLAINELRTLLQNRLMDERETVTEATSAGARQTQRREASSEADKEEAA
ncbi:MAG: diadenylate cyclase CdaA [Phycisphaeraceae bacterium]|nr:diadenylate cyclase CdaA [Phycisphaeraceae bacterium]MCW5754756.1 diadenylate cyclase CdaA [Phycisphaeraceae bacterium]